MVVLPVVLFILGFAGVLALKRFLFISGFVLEPLLTGFSDLSEEDFTRESEDFLL